MKKTAVAVMAVLALAGVTGAQEVAEGPEVSVSLAIASAYAFRGVTLNGGPVVQPGLEVSGPGWPITIGVWGNLDIDDDDGAYTPGQFSEIDLYASYAIPVDPVELSIGYTEYTYPGGAGDPVISTDGDGNATAEAVSVPADREISVSASLDCLLSPSVSLHYGLAGGLAGVFYGEAGVEQALSITDELEIVLSAALACTASADGAGFPHFTVGGEAAYGPVSLGVTYIGRIDESLLDDEAYRVPVVATLGVGYDF